MLAIRLQRMGAKKRPYFRVVVTESRSARDSSFIEVVGHYDPRARPAAVRFDQERLRYWVERGAQMSDTVRSLAAGYKEPAAAEAPAAVEQPAS